MTTRTRRMLIGALIAVHVMALALWFGALLTPAIAAMCAFPILRDMPMRLDAYAAYDGAPHGMVAAGHVLDGVFHITDALCLYAGAAAIFTLGALTMMGAPSLGRKRLMLRWACMVIAAGALAVYLFMLVPNLQESLAEYRTLATAGRNDEAAIARAAFQEAHPRASVAATIMMIGVFIALATAAIPSTKPRAST